MTSLCLLVAVVVVVVSLGSMAFFIVIVVGSHITGRLTKIERIISRSYSRISDPTSTVGDAEGRLLLLVASGIL